MPNGKASKILVDEVNGLRLAVRSLLRNFETETGLRVVNIELRRAQSYNVWLAPYDGELDVQIVVVFP